MGSEEANDPLKGIDWKNIGSSENSARVAASVAKKRPRRKFKEIPECYFLPRRSMRSAVALYGSLAAAGVGTGMLIEMWMKKKIEADGGVLWEIDW